MKTHIVYVNVASNFNNITSQEAIKRGFQEVFVLSKVKVQSICHTRIKS